MPDRSEFAYTFDRFGELVDGLLDQLGVSHYAMYVMDYGAPVGWRLALKHPDRITGLIVQNGNAYEEGLKEFWDPIKAYWSDHSEDHRKALHVLVSPETTKFQYTDGVSDISRIAPDNWVYDQVLLDRPGNVEIQMDLFYDYRTNLPLYPEVQAYFRKHQPPTLIVWGKNDKIFPADGAYPYKRDLPSVEFSSDTDCASASTPGATRSRRVRSAPVTSSITWRTPSDVTVDDVPSGADMIGLWPRFRVSSLRTS